MRVYGRPVPGRKVPEAERREQLLQACYAVARRDGLDGVTARSVAAEAGASPGLVFFHFGSKDALVAAMMSALLAAALDAEVTPELAALPPRERLRAMVRAELEGIPEQREPVELLLAGWFVGRELRGLIADALEAYRRVFVPVCAEATGTDGEALATVVVGIVQGAAFTSVRDPAAWSEESTTTALALLP
jgi:TetR/AcrR family transcriptional regulator, transcriptional repressor of bet genes